MGVKYLVSPKQPRFFSLRPRTLKQASVEGVEIHFLTPRSCFQCWAHRNAFNSLHEQLLLKYLQCMASTKSLSLSGRVKTCREAQRMASRESTSTSPRCCAYSKGLNHDFEAFCTRWIDWTLHPIRTKDSAKQNILRPLRSSPGILQSKCWQTIPRKMPCSSRRFANPSMACLGRCVSTLHNQQPQASRCRFQGLHQAGETSDSSQTSPKPWQCPGARSEHQELTQRLNTVLNTDMSNLVSALLLAPEAAAICKGLWPCLGDAVLGFIVHCRQVCFVAMFSWSSLSRSPACWSATATCRFHLLQAWQRRVFVQFGTLPFCPVCPHACFNFN